MSKAMPDVEQAPCIEFAPAAQALAVVEQAGVEEVRRQAPGLGLEFAEAQHFGVPRRKSRNSWRKSDMAADFARGIAECTGYNRRHDIDCVALMRIITLNLNGIRSAASKGLAGWLAHVAPMDVCACRRVKAQPPTCRRSMRAPRSARAFPPRARRKGYTGVGVVRAQHRRRSHRLRHQPSSMPRGATSRREFRKLTVISCTSRPAPAARSGRRRSSASWTRSCRIW